MTTRADLGRHLTLEPSAPTKTFVLEVHTDAPLEYLRDIGGRGSVESTEDVYLQRLVTESGDFWVDRIDPRFWSFHTQMTGAQAGGWLHEHVESRRDTDWMWLPSDHLRRIAPGAISRKVRTEFDGARFLGANETAQDLKVQLTGSNAELLIDSIGRLPGYTSAVSVNSIEVELDDPDLGRLREAVKRSGSFAATGEDFVHHAQFVRSVVDRYALLVRSVEGVAYEFESLPQQADEGGGGRLAGAPIGIQFSRPIPDLERFCDELFSARWPFRLWGRPVIADGWASADAVDLHVGQTLRVDIGLDWMRVYLRAGSCGNTVARLISNLQSRFDGALTITHEGISAAVALRQDLSTTTPTA